ncbi:hypothetical protein [Nocardia asteroides]|uniref:hypothetical protein n=1 Tax=Nocardia asteroides TaxID=1824 RepID=UPI0033E39AE2
MAIDFIPEFWSDQLLMPYEAELVFGQPKIANTKYEGVIKAKGDTVHVGSISDPTVRTYDKSTDITIEELEDDEDTLVIDQGDYFAFYVKDIEKHQAAANYEDPAMSRAAYKMRDKVDAFLYGKLTAGAAASNQLGRVSITAGRPEQAATGQLDMYTVAVKLREKLDRASIPKTGRYIALPPELQSPLLLDSRFIHASKLGQAGPLLNGQIGEMAGFAVLNSNQIGKVGGAGANKDDYVVVSGVADALSYANQLTEVETIRAEKRFANIVRGLNVYGGKVFHPTAVATASVLPVAPA